MVGVEVCEGILICHVVNEVLEKVITHRLSKTFVFQKIGIIGGKEQQILRVI